MKLQNFIVLTLIFGDKMLKKYRQMLSKNQEYTICFLFPGPLQHGCLWTCLFVQTL